MHTVKSNRQCFSSNQDRSNLKLKIPPPAWMFLFAGLMWLLDTHLPVATWLDRPLNQLGWAIMALSFLPAAGAFRLFSHFDTTPDPFHPEKASKLVTSGIYSYSRNPMYLGLLLLLTGWAVYLGSVVAVLFPPLFVWVINTRQIRWEELALKKVFGQEYLDYKIKVRRWL